MSLLKRIGSTPPAQPNEPAQAPAPRPEEPQRPAAPLADVASQSLEQRVAAEPGESDVSSQRMLELSLWIVDRIQNVDETSKNS